MQAVQSKLAVTLTAPSIMPETSLSELAPKAEEYLVEIKLRPKDGRLQEYISIREKYLKDFPYIGLKFFTIYDLENDA